MQTTDSSFPLPVVDPSPTVRRYGGDILADIFAVGTIRRADEITGGLSKPSKMPEYGYSLPAQRCRIGSRLATVPGTVCSDCYALKGRFRIGTVRDAMERRFRGLLHPQWVPGMVLLLRRRYIEFFRWHDSGDLQSVEHLANIAEVARYTPGTHHWLPTREYAIVRDLWDEMRDRWPANLLVRLSAHRVGEQGPRWWPHTSVVLEDGESWPDDVARCPAPEQGGVCGECRACWNPDVGVVGYGRH